MYSRRWLIVASILALLLIVVPSEANQAGGRQLKGGDGASKVVGTKVAKTPKLVKSPKGTGTPTGVASPTLQPSAAPSSEPTMTFAPVAKAVKSKKGMEGSMMGTKVKTKKGSKLVSVRRRRNVLDEGLIAHVDEVDHNVLGASDGSWLSSSSEAAFDVMAMFAAKAPEDRVDPTAPSDTKVTLESVGAPKTGKAPKGPSKVTSKGPTTTSSPTLSPSAPSPISPPAASPKSAAKTKKGLLLPNEGPLLPKDVSKSSSSGKGMKGQSKPGNPKGATVKVMAMKRRP